MEGWPLSGCVLNVGEKHCKNVLEINLKLVYVYLVRGMRVAGRAFLVEGL